MSTTSPAASLSAAKAQLLKRGTAIPASPLALTRERKFDERHQRALYRYYAAAGSGGVAVGVHSTQFEIREPRYGLFRPVLELAAETLNSLEQQHARPLLKVAGACGATAQAVAEAELARSLGYDLVLLSLGAMRHASEDELITHCEAVSEVLPIIGFYLQPAVGGRVLPYSFWRRFAEIPNVAAIKIAPFNRYQTFDVVRAVAEAGREEAITLYTGNDDNIIADLITPYPIHTGRGLVEMRIRGGLLGQWSVWTKRAVELLERCHEAVAGGETVPVELLRKNVELTDANAVVFDAAHAFHGCIPGLHEILHRQGLMDNILCLDPDETLSPGQSEELDRIYRSYSWLTDDDFVREHLDEWLK